MHVIAIHGGFLKLVVYGGLLSLIIFLYFCKTLFSIALKAYKTSRDKFQSYAGYCLMIILIVLIPMNLSADNLGLAITWIVVFYLLAISSFAPLNGG